MSVLVFIHPSVTHSTKDKDLGGELGLSIPELRGEVSRYKQINYTGFNGEGTPIEAFAAGFHARVVQHEMDHLDGILYPDRMIDLTRFGYVDEFAKIQEQKFSPDTDNKDGRVNG